jgi:hypothetical protein
MTISICDNVNSNFRENLHQCNQVHELDFHNTNICNQPNVSDCLQSSYCQGFVTQNQFNTNLCATQGEIEGKHNNIQNCSNSNVISVNNVISGLNPSIELNSSNVNSIVC